MVITMLTLSASPSFRVACDSLGAKVTLSPSRSVNRSSPVSKVSSPFISWLFRLLEGRYLTPLAMS